MNKKRKGNFTDGSSAKRRRLDNLDSDPYDEELYIIDDDEDRRRMQSLNDLERQTEFALRFEHRKRIQERNEAKQQMAQEKTHGSVSKKSSIVDVDTSSDEDDDIDEVDMTKVYTQPQNDVDTEEMEELPECDLTVRDLRKCQLIRDKVEGLCNEPYFQDFIRGLFVRLYVGPDENKVQQYRIAQIKKIATYPHSYKLTNKRKTKMALVLKIGGHEKMFKMNALSNQGFTEKEFQDWLRAMKPYSKSIPKKAVLQDLVLRAKKTRDEFVYNDKVLANMRKKMGTKDVKAIRNLENERLKLQMDLQFIQQDEDDEDEEDNQDGKVRKNKITALESRLMLVNEEIDLRNSSVKSSAALLQNLNEKFKKRDIATKRRYLKNHGQSLDNSTFSRARTLPKIERFNVVEETKEEKEAKSQREIDELLYGTADLDDDTLVVTATPAPQLVSGLDDDEDISQFRKDETRVQDPLYSVVQYAGKRALPDRAKLKEFVQFVRKLPDAPTPEAWLGRAHGSTAFAEEFERTPQETATLLTVQQYRDGKYGGKY